MNTSTQEIILKKLHVASVTANEGLQTEEMKVRTPSPCVQENAPGSLGVSKGLESFRREGRLLGRAYAKALIA